VGLRLGLAEAGVARPAPIGGNLSLRSWRARAPSVVVVAMLLIWGCRARESSDRDNVPESGRKESGSASASCLNGAGDVVGARVLPVAPCQAGPFSEFPDTQLARLSDAIRECMTHPNSRGDRCANTATLEVDVAGCGVAMASVACADRMHPDGGCLLRLGVRTYGPCYALCQVIWSVPEPACCWEDRCSGGSPACCAGGQPGQWDGRTHRCVCGIGGRPSMRD
jgi:hypothetical protein